MLLIDRLSTRPWRAALYVVLLCISLPLMDLPVEMVKIPFYYAFLILAVVTVYSSYWIKHAKFGLGLEHGLFLNLEFGLDLIDNA